MINHYDWKIHKILSEERDRQRADRLWLLKGRGNGKTTLWMEEFTNYITSTSKPEPVKLCKSNIELIKKTVIDYDMHNYLVPPYRDAIDEFFEGEMRKHIRKDIENWKPKVYLDTSLINPRDWYTKQLTIMDSVLGSFIVASEEDE